MPPCGRDVVGCMVSASLGAPHRWPRRGRPCRDKPSAGKAVRQGVRLSVDVRVKLASGGYESAPQSTWKLLEVDRTRNTLGSYFWRARSRERRGLGNRTCLLLEGNGHSDPYAEVGALLSSLGQEALGERATVFQTGALIGSSC